MASLRRSVALTILGFAEAATVAMWLAILRAVAWVHVAGVLLSIRIVGGRAAFDGIDSGLGVFAFLAYFVASVMIPALVIAFMTPPHRPLPAGALPPGYEHLDPSTRGLGRVEKLLVIGLASLTAALFLVGWLLLAIVVVPVAFGLYYIVGLFRDRRGAPPTAARRMRLSPKLQKPAQTHSYWTVNRAEFKDPDLYDQDS